jgi:hypothetical protein
MVYYWPAMNEEQTKHDLVIPALHAARWNDAPYRLALEQDVAPGRVEHDGRSHALQRAALLARMDEASPHPAEPLRGVRRTRRHPPTEKS